MPRQDTCQRLSVINPGTKLYMRSERYSEVVWSHDENFASGYINKYKYSRILMSYVINGCTTSSIAISLAKESCPRLEVAALLPYGHVQEVATRRECRGNTFSTPSPLYPYPRNHPTNRPRLTETIHKNNTDQYGQ